MHQRILLTVLYHDQIGQCEALSRLFSAGQLPPSEAAALEHLLKTLVSGSDAATAWERGRDELKDLIARKTQTAVAEHKRLCDLNCILTAEQVGAMIAARRETVKPVSEKSYRKLMERTCQPLPGRPPDVQAQEGNR